MQSALLEVMQERQVTIGHETHHVPAPFLVLATQNPIESEGTYPLPEAQVDRFMFKLVVDYPTTATRSPSSSARWAAARAREVLSPEHLAAHQRAARAVFVDRRVMEYAVELTTATREPGEEDWVEFGASPRGSINLVHAGRALALLRGRDYVLPVDVRDLARDVLRHRIVLTYEALAAGVDADRVLDDVLESVPCRTSSCDAGAPYGDVSFREPPLLLALALLPLALAAYVLAQRRARQFAVRYTNVDVLASRRGPLVERHIPAALALLALAALLIALARPQRTVAAERRRPR